MRIPSIVMLDEQTKKVNEFQGSSLPVASSFHLSYCAQMNRANKGNTFFLVAHFTKQGATCPP
jgi:hypothetical protein